MLRRICWQSAAAAFLLLASALPARLALAEQPQTASGIDALRAYAGTWKITIDHRDTPYSKAGHETSTLHNDCWESGPYFACRQIVDGDSKVLLVFTCNGEHDCTSYQIPPPELTRAQVRSSSTAKPGPFPGRVPRAEKPPGFVS